MEIPASANNPDLRAMFEALERDNSYDDDLQKTKARFLTNVDQSRNLDIWRNPDLEKVDTAIGAFASTESLKRLTEKSFQEKDTEVYLQIRELLEDEVSRIWNFMDLAAHSETKLGLEDYKIEGDFHPHGGSMSFETSDGFKFHGEGGMIASQFMANPDKGLNVTHHIELHGSDSMNGIDTEVVHSFGDEPAPLSEGVLVKTDGTEDGDIFEVSGEHDNLIYHLDLLSEPERVSLKQEF